LSDTPGHVIFQCLIPGVLVGPNALEKILDWCHLIMQYRSKCDLTYHSNSHNNKQYHTKIPILDLSFTDKHSRAHTVLPADKLLCSEYCSNTLVLVVFTHGIDFCALLDGATLVKFRMVVGRWHLERKFSIWDILTT
jgi:hypothetical protein